MLVFILLSQIILLGCYKINEKELLVLIVRIYLVWDLNVERIETTEARAKEVKAIADSLISLAIKEKDNFEMADVKVSKAKLDSKGNKVTELVKSKNGKEYLKVVREEVTEKRQKDMPEPLNPARE